MDCSLIQYNTINSNFLSFYRITFRIYTAITNLEVVNYIIIILNYTVCMVNTVTIPPAQVEQTHQILIN